MHCGLRLTRLAWHALSANAQWSARENGYYISTAASRLSGYGDDDLQDVSIDLGSQYGDVTTTWRARRHGGSSYLDVEIEQKKTEPKWGLCSSEIYLGEVPVSVCMAHRQRFETGTLMASDVIGHPALEGREIDEIAAPDSFTMTTYVMSGHWSDDAVEEYPVTMADWRNWWGSRERKASAG